MEYWSDGFMEYSCLGLTPNCTLWSLCLRGEISVLVAGIVHD